MSEERRQILNLLAAGKVSVDEAERLIAAVGASQQRQATAEAACCAGDGVDCCTDGSTDCCEPGSDCCREAGAETTAGKSGVAPKYLCVKIHGGDDNINVRVPLALLRAGMQLRSLMPEKARAQVDEKLAAHGVNLNAKNLEEVITQLCNCHLDMRGKHGETVQLCCR